MTYVYECSSCMTEVEIDCMMDERNDERHCDVCGCMLKRVYLSHDHYWIDCEWPGGYKGTIDKR